MVNYLKRYGPSLAPQLLPGERLFAMISAGYIPSNEDIGPPDPRMTVGQWVEAQMLGLPMYTRLADRMVGGTSLAGPEACLAIGLRDVLAPMNTFLILSDQRLLVAENPLEYNAAPKVVWAAGRGIVREMVRAPRLFQYGRVILTLADGSKLAVMTGVIRSAPAKRFVRAWQAGPAFVR